MRLHFQEVLRVAKFIATESTRGFARVGGGKMRSSYFMETKFQFRKVKRLLG